MRCKPHVNMNLVGGWVQCLRWQNLSPILDVTTDEGTVLLGPPSDVMTETDVQHAAALLAAVCEYAGEVGRIYAEQNDIPVEHVVGPHAPRRRVVV